VTDADTGTADLLAIHDLAYRYAAGVDRRDRQLFLSAFRPDATLTVRRPGPDGEVRDSVRTGHDQLGTVTEVIARYAKTFHFVGNHRVEVAGDTATGEVYCTAHHLDPGPHGGTDYTMLIRYLDTYRRDPGGPWLIASRRLEVDWTEVQAADAVTGR
jgi:ketosteroid isomerase-like protein